MTGNDIPGIEKIKSNLGGWRQVEMSAGWEYADGRLDDLEGNMPGLWLHLDSDGRTALVVGGGRVASRKATVLAEAGVCVRLVAPAVSDDLRRLEQAEKLSVREGCFAVQDLEGCFLVVAATDDPAVNREVATEGLRRGLLVNVADAPEEGNCRFPALLRRGGLEVAVSTGGRCPGYAAEIRNLIAGQIGEEYGELLETLASERDKLLTEGRNSTYNNQILRARIMEMLARLETCEDSVP